MSVPQAQAVPPGLHVYEGESIQNVIDLASSGDTIYVHTGTYNERLIISKSLNLIGLKAVIQYSIGGGAILIEDGSQEMNVRIRGFTIIGMSGIISFMDHNVDIIDNTIIGLGIGTGISVYWSNDHNIIRNRIIGFYIGIKFVGFSYCKVIGNRIEDCSEAGIYFELSGTNEFTGNTIINCETGIYAYIGSARTDIIRNKVLECETGILFEFTNRFNRITQNTVKSEDGSRGIALVSQSDDNEIFKNRVDGFEYDLYEEDSTGNLWENNKYTTSNF